MDHVHLNAPSTSTITRACTDCGAAPCKRGLKRGRCRKCYERHLNALKKAGDFTSQGGRAEPLQRLLAKAEAGPRGCLIYTGHIHKVTGYGSFKFAVGQQATAHRAAYELMVGPVPEGMHIDHACHNRDASCPGGGRECLHRRCINPHHLEPVPPRENALRSALTLAGANVRKTHCTQGHEYSAENTYSVPSRPGTRYCRECSRQRKQNARKAGGAR